MADQSSSETPIALALGLLASILGAVWAGAWASTMLFGRHFNGRFGEALAALLGYLQGESPAEAWSNPSVPSMVVVAPVSIVIWLILVACVVLVAKKLRLGSGFAERKRGGTTAEARIATARELANLRWRRPQPGRFYLGHIGRVHLATPNRLLDGGGLGRLDRFRSRLWTQDRDNANGHVALIGLTQVGKSQALMTALRYLSMVGGPMILSSVKDDLLEHLLAQRRQVGRVGVFDPSGQLEAGYERRQQGSGAPVAPGWDNRLIVGWSPLHGVRTFDDAVKSTKRLAGPGTGGDDKDNRQFWDKLAAQLIAPMVFAAAMDDKTMGDVAQWILSKDEPVDGDDGREYTPVVVEILERLAGGRDTLMAEDANKALTSLEGLWAGAQQTVGSIYATASTIVEPWQTRAGRRSSSQNLIDLDWLLDGGGASNTLFISAPPQEQKALRPVLAGSIEALLDDLQRWVEVNGRIDPPLTVVLDEIGNAPLPKLREYLSVLASTGTNVVTLWQDLAQMKAAYGDGYTTVLNNSRYIVAFGGSKDTLLVDWLTKVTGQEGAGQVSKTRQSADWGGGSVSESEQRVDLLPGNIARELSAGQAILLAGNNRPAIITTVPEYSVDAFDPHRVWPHGVSRIGLPFTDDLPPTIVPSATITDGKNPLMALLARLWSPAKPSKPNSGTTSAGGQATTRKPFTPGDPSPAEPASTVDGLSTSTESLLGRRLRELEVSSARRGRGPSSGLDDLL